VRLPTPVANELAGRVLAHCVERGVLPAGEPPDWGRFLDFRTVVRERFDVPETSITPLMARVLYGVSTLARPGRVLGIGTYAGNALVWLVGPGFSPHRVYDGELAVGADSDAGATELARRNLASIGVERVELRCEDGHVTPTALGERWDLVLLDADDPVTRKGVYLSLLDAVHPFLAAGGLLLAHDICVPIFRADMGRYQEAVRDPERFAATVPLEIDECGLEVSVKRRPRPRQAGAMPLDCRVCGLP
jgi:predicted O-methyltransferase YrrM